MASFIGRSKAQTLGLVRVLALATHSRRSCCSLSGAAVTLTNFDPQEIDNCCAADVYVLLKGCVELLAKFAKIAMESCRHELQVGREPPGSSWPIGR